MYIYICIYIYIYIYVYTYMHPASRRAAAGVPAHGIRPDEGRPPGDGAFWLLHKCVYIYIYIERER